MKKTKREILLEKRAMSPEQRRAEFSKSLKRRINILFFNIKPLIIFEILYKALSSLILIPLIWLFVYISMKACGLKYITQDNLVNFLTHPLTLLFLVVLILILSILCMIEISSAIFCFEVSRQKKKTNLKDIIINGTKNSLKIIYPKNLIIIPFILIFFPILNIGTSSVITSSFSIPNSWIDFVSSNIWIFIIVLIAFIVVFYLICRCMFAVQYFVLEDLNFTTCVKKSSQLARGNYIKNIISIAIVQILIYLSSFLLNLLAQQLSLLAIGIFGNKSIISSVLIAILLIIFIVVYYILQGFFMPISCWRISTLFYEDKILSEEKIKNYKYKEAKKKKGLIKKGITFIAIPLIIVIGAFSVTIYSISNQLYSINSDSLGLTKTCAYKNFSTNSPSYSIAAINEAKELGAEYIYENIFLTKDQQFIPYDMTGYVAGSDDVNKNINDYSYDEINSFINKNLASGLSAATSKDVSSILNYLKNRQLNDNSQTELSDQLVPKLSELLQKAKEIDIQLIIDIDHIDNDYDTAKNIISLIEVNYSLEKCQLVSNNYNTLTTYKDVNNKIYTIYKNSIALGNMEELDKIDAVAIDMYNVNQLQIRNFHTANKAVYVWNVDKKDNITTAVESKADVIVTKHVKDSVEICARKALPEFVIEIYKNIKQN